MSMQDIRENYKVPAKRGARIEFHDPTALFIMGFLYSPKKGTIVASRGQYIRVRFDGEQIIRTLHPKSCVRYL
jgi:hypothetical protein